VNFQGDPTITTWPKRELRKIAETGDLHISPFRDGGVTYGTPTWIWSVAVDDALYVRRYNGQNSPLAPGRDAAKGGAITAAAMTKDVTFEPVNGAINDRVDEAYRTKYKRSPYLKPMIGSRARSATVKVTPREIKVSK